MRTTDELIALAEKGVKAALAAGADASEVYVTEGRATTVSAAGRHVIPTESSDLALGVRLVSGGRVGLSGASTPEGIERAIADALQSVRDIAAKSDAAALPSAVAERAPRVAIDAQLAAERIDEPSAFVEALVATALDDPRVTYVDAKVASHFRRIAVANSTGLAAWDEVAWERSDLEVRCSRGSTHRSGREGAMSRGAIESSFDASAVARQLIDRVGSALDASPLAGPAVEEAIFLPGPASQILGMVAPGFAARAGAGGVSANAGKLGADLYAPCITITDEPRGPTGVRRRNIDDEGTPTAETRIVESGRFVGMLHDSRTAARAGVASTGNGVRGSVSGGVAPGSINLALAPGERTLDDLIVSAERAVVVNDVLLGSFTHNTTTGDFSVVVPYAFLVENGRVKHALPPTTIGGNAHRVLREARALGRERKACAQGTVPAIHAGGVSCAT